MSKQKILKQLMGATALAALLGATAVQAQSPQGGHSATSSSAAGQTGAGSSGTATDTAGAAGKSATALSRADKKMLTDMAQANINEIEASRIVHGKTQNTQVKTFAQQMIDDHTLALQEVQQVAQAKGVTLPTESDGKHKRAAQQLQSLSGDEMDRRYMQLAGAAEHKKTHTLLQRAQARATDPDIRALAGRLQPAVAQHLTSVEQLSAAMKGSGTATGSSGTAGASGSGTGGKSGAAGSGGTSGSVGGSGTSGTSGSAGGSGSSGSSGTGSSGSGGSGTSGSSGSSGTGGSSGSSGTSGSSGSSGANGTSGGTTGS